MPCRGVYFALDSTQEARLLSHRTDEKTMKCIEEEIEGIWDEDWLAETDKAWDAIHRCLSEGSLRCRGENILEKFVLCGRQLHRSSAYTVSYLTHDEVRELSETAAGVTKDLFRKRYFGLASVKLGFFDGRYEGIGE